MKNNGGSSKERATKKANKKINCKLNEFIKAFIDFRAKSEDKNGIDVSMKLSELDFEWKRYCNKSWKTNHPYNTFTETISNLLNQEEVQRQEILQKKNQQPIVEIEKGE